MVSNTYWNKFSTTLNIHSLSLDSMKSHSFAQGNILTIFLLTLFLTLFLLLLIKEQSFSYFLKILIEEFHSRN